MTPEQWNHAETTANRAAAASFTHDIYWLLLAAAVVAVAVYLWRTRS